MDGTLGNRAIDITSTSAGSTCVILDSGKVLCWGQGEKLGNGSSGNKNIPFYVDETEISGAAGESAVKLTGDSLASQSSTCAIMDDGRMKCWGRNSNYLLGDPNYSENFSLYPKLVDPLRFDGSSGNKIVTSVVELNQRALVRTDGGRVFWWGLHDDKMSPLGVSQQRLAYVDDSLLDGQGGFTSIDANTETTCGVLLSGKIACWGNNAEGQLGIGNFASKAIPQISASSIFDGTEGAQAIAVAVGINHACALSQVGTVYCWGDNASGQLGRGDTTGESLTPVQVDSANIDGTGNKKAVGLAAAGYGTCAIMQDGTIRCWGKGLTTGNGTGSDTGVSVQVTSTYFDGSEGKKAIAISGKANTMCAVTDGGLVRCWGDNSDRMLGNNNYPTDSLIPTPTDTAVIDGVSAKAISIGVGVNSACAGLNDGTLACWGNNGEEQIGDLTDTHRSVPTLVSQNSINGSTNNKAVAVAVGDKHACAVVDSKRVFCWGKFSDYQLGTGITQVHDEPTIVLEVGDDPAFLNSAAVQKSVFSLTGP